MPQWIMFQQANNVLSRRYTEKIASSLAREGVTTAIDTMNYLIKINSAWKTSTPTNIQINSKNVKLKEEEISDEELESILAAIESKKKD